MNIREKLYAWRDNEAKTRQVEPFRIFPNATLDELSVSLPQTKEELCLVKGIKELKYAQYGKILLSIIKGEELEMEHDKDNDEHKAISVTSFLQQINQKISAVRSKISGEVISCSEKGNAVYFTLRDPQNENTLSAFMWKSTFLRYGSSLPVGESVVIFGIPEIYLPTGRLSVRVEAFELTGDGLLKKAYDELYKKLEREGVFSKDQKRELPELPKRIGLITSKQGAVIHDFLSNLLPYGFEISFIDSRVEGILAVNDILHALDSISKTDVDVLVIIRGGGSLSSLQAFNNEEVVRKIANMNVPVICSIGHDKDVPLAQLAADYSTSTPSLTTQLLHTPFVEANLHLSHTISNFSSLISDIPAAIENEMRHASVFLESNLERLKDIPVHATRELHRLGDILSFSIREIVLSLQSKKSIFLGKFDAITISIDTIIRHAEKDLTERDPKTQLKRGFSIVRQHDMIIKSINDFNTEDQIEVELHDGMVSANITHLRKK